MLMIPKNCPVCDTSLERVNDQLFCRNNSCEAKSSKSLLHFIKTMKIKGLGEKTLEKLNIESINQLYELTLKDLISTLQEKVGTKIFNEINKSKEIPLAIFIQSFGITLIGNSASTKLAKHCASMQDITTNTCKKAGLGEKATNNLLQWINSNRDKYSDLPITPSTISTITETEEKFKVTITGKLNDFTSRTKAKDFLETKGISILSGVSSKAKYLICDTGNTTSSSYMKATKLNIPVITMNDLLNIINGDINV